VGVTVLQVFCVVFFDFTTFTQHHIRDKSMTDIQEITEKLLHFRNERDWEQFHNPKDLALAISIESAELLELFLWKNPGEEKVDRVKEELADIFSFALLMAEKYNLDVKQIVLDKIKTNGEKYPVDKAKGTATKYDEL
jgi:NTP pyrophosphatase (non-canonical NTP hydrolase)